MAAKTKILCDTNFLVDYLKLKIDLGVELARLIELNYELLIVPGVEEELATLAEQGDQFARAAIELIHMGQVKKMYDDYKGDVDEIIFEACKEDKNIVVATDDIRLREKLKAMYIKTIYIRARKHLAID